MKQPMCDGDVRAGEGKLTVKILWKLFFSVLNVVCERT